jgi:hypothetical protein
MRAQRKLCAYVCVWNCEASYARREINVYFPFVQDTSDPHAKKAVCGPVCVCVCVRATTCETSYTGFAPLLFGAGCK